MAAGVGLEKSVLEYVTHPSWHAFKRSCYLHYTGPAPVTFEEVESAGKNLPSNKSVLLRNDFRWSCYLHHINWSGPRGKPTFEDAALAVTISKLHRAGMARVEKPNF